MIIKKTTHKGSNPKKQVKPLSKEASKKVVEPKKVFEEKPIIVEEKPIIIEEEDLLLIDEN